MHACFEIAPRGPFSLRAAAGFEFAGTLNAPPFDGTLRLAFATDDLRRHVGVILRQDGDEAGTVRGELHGDADVAGVCEQVARILSLDHDGSAWTAAGERDPVIGRLQAGHPGLRPVLFHSPYEAAAWAIISARRPAAHAAGARDALAARLGATFQLGGVRVPAFPLPRRLLECDELPGLTAEKVARLRAVAEAALGGRLDAATLRTQDPAEALAQLQTLRASARSTHSSCTSGPAGSPMLWSTNRVRWPARRTSTTWMAQPTATRSSRSPSRGARFRTWATVLLRVAGDRAGVSGR